MVNATDYTIQILEKNKHNLKCVLALEDFCFSKDKTSQQTYTKLFNRQNTTIFGVHYKGDLIGSAITISRTGGDYRLYSLGVMPSHRDVGVGNALLDAVERWCVHQKATLLQFETRSDNMNAMIFYKQRGYRIFGTYKNFYEEGAAAVRLVKKLKAVT